MPAAEVVRLMAVEKRSLIGACVENPSSALTTGSVTPPGKRKVAGKNALDGRFNVPSVAMPGVGVKYASCG
jgi:hypothetical protein